jgi:glycyl-tRNA synthetase
MSNTPKLEDIVSLAKRRGFIFPGSEIYGGLAGTFDYGPLGVALKENIKKLWWKMFVTDREDMYGIDAAILMNPKAWEASGHVSGFNDPMVECKECKGRFRADHIEDMNTCPSCEKKGTLGEARTFNMMFKTKAGATDDEGATVYLRPETAGGMFVNFKNVVDSFHPKLPFGLAQIGKAFRNEIAPRDFIFRLRELEQMEVEYFVRPENWESAFQLWHGIMHAFAKAVGIKKEHLHDTEIPDGERAHYSSRTIDFEFDYSFGKKELWGLAYRTDYDLKAHSETSKTDLSYFDEETKERSVPHVIEPSLGVDRTILAVLTSAYTVDEMGGEERSYLKLPKEIAPIRVAVFPLLKNKPELVAKAREVFVALKQAGFSVVFDDNGNIGKRYRRQDEIGTPHCVTIDFDTLGETPALKDTVTVRDRDTGEQKRVALSELCSVL